MCGAWLQLTIAYSTPSGFEPLSPQRFPKLLEPVPSAEDQRWHDTIVPGLEVRAKMLPYQFVPLYIHTHHSSHIPVVSHLISCNRYTTLRFVFTVFIL